MDLTLKSLCGAAALFAGLSASTAFADDANPVRNRTISYATVTMHWSVYQTADAKAECPNPPFPSVSSGAAASPWC